MASEIPGKPTCRRLKVDNTLVDLLRLSECTGVAALLGSLPQADCLLADRGYDAGWFREALKDKGIKLCIPGRRSRGGPVKHDTRR